MAIKSSGWKSRAYILNHTKDKVIVISFWKRLIFGSIRQIYLICSDEKNWIKGRGIEGIPEIVDDNALQKLIRKGDSPKEIVVLAKKILDEFEIKEWMSLNNENHVRFFNDLTFGLHDSVFYKVEIVINETFFYVDTSWQCHLIIKCTDVKLNNIPIDTIFYDSSISFDKGLTTLKLEGDSKDDNVCLVCAKIEYKIVTIGNDEKIERYFDNFKEVGKGIIGSNENSIEWIFAKMKLEMWPNCGEWYVSVQIKRKSGKYAEITHLHVEDGEDFKKLISDINNENKVIRVNQFLIMTTFKIIDKAKIRLRPWSYYSE